MDYVRQITGACSQVIMQIILHYIFEIKHEDKKMKLCWERAINFLVSYSVVDQNKRKHENGIAEQVF